MIYMEIQNKIVMNPFSLAFKSFDCVPGGNGAKVQRTRPSIMAGKTDLRSRSCVVRERSKPRVKACVCKM